MKYALKISDNNRILSATYPQFAPSDAVTVDTLPEGDISDYRYINGEFVYDPLLEPEIVDVPTTTDRLAALEAAMLEIILGGADL